MMKSGFFKNLSKTTMQTFKKFRETISDSSEKLLNKNEKFNMKNFQAVIAENFSLDQQAVKNFLKDLDEDELNIYLWKHQIDDAKKKIKKL